MIIYFNKLNYKVVNEDPKVIFDEFEEKKDELCEKLKEDIQERIKPTERRPGIYSMHHPENIWFKHLRGIRV